jgi:hypothetical protein
MGPCVPIRACACENVPTRPCGHTWRISIEFNELGTHSLVVLQRLHGLRDRASAWQSLRDLRLHASASHPLPTHIGSSGRYAECSTLRHFEDFVALRLTCVAEQLLQLSYCQALHSRGPLELPAATDIGMLIFEPVPYDLTSDILSCISLCCCWLTRSRLFSERCLVFFVDDSSSHAMSTVACCYHSCLRMSLLIACSRQKGVFSSVHGPTYSAVAMIRVTVVTPTT